MSVRPQTLATLLFLASLALSAFFFAQGSTSLLATKLFGAAQTSPGTQGARAAVPAAAAPTRARVDGRAILERNIFVRAPDVAATDGGVAETVEPVVLVDESLVSITEFPPCSGDVKVLGAMINPGNPQWSYAALGQGNAAALLYRVGQTVAGRTIASVDNLPEPEQNPPLPGNQRRHRTRVVLRETTGAHCQIAMFGSGAATAATPAATAAPAAGAAPASAPGAPTPPGGPAVAPPAPPAGEVGAADLEAGITRNSDTNYTVNRALMERVLSQQDALFRSTRLIPNEENGSVNGMKIYGIRRSSVLGRLGIQNGDVLQTVNGLPMTSADALMAAYSGLSRAGTFTIQVVRRGQTMNLQYTVQ